jgi:hypothetical protein
MIPDEMNVFRRPDMSQTTQFGEVLDAADHLSSDEKEELIAILRRRLAEEGRKRVVADVQESKREFNTGTCRPASADELMREIAS